MQAYNLSKSKKYNDELSNFLPGGVTHNFHGVARDAPIHFSHAKGSRLWDLDGNEYLDLCTKFGSVILGHNNPLYIDKMTQRMNRVTAVGMSDNILYACELINSCVKSAEMIRFSLSGSEAVSNALRLSRAYTGRNKVLRFQGHFHGTFDNILGGQTLPDSPHVFDGNEGVFQTKGRATDVLENEMLMIEWNDKQLLTNTLAEFHSDIAAVILEVQAVNAGSFLPKQDFLMTLREQCTKYGIVLIFDEIITGIRVGLGGAQALYNVVPDITILGKAITNGIVPMSVVAGKRDLMKLYEQGEVIYGGTHNAYPFGLEAICITLEIIKQNEEVLYANMRTMMNNVQEVFLKEAANSDLPISFRGHYSCSSVFYKKGSQDTNKMNSDSSAKENAIIRNCLLRYGILIAPTTRLFSTLVLDASDIDFLSERLSYALKEIKILFKRTLKEEK